MTEAQQRLRIAIEFVTGALHIGDMTREQCDLFGIAYPASPYAVKWIAADIIYGSFTGAVDLKSESYLSGKFGRLPAPVVMPLMPLSTTLVPPPPTPVQNDSVWLLYTSLTGNEYNLDDNYIFDSITVAKDFVDTLYPESKISDWMFDYSGNGSGRVRGWKRFFYRKAAKPREDGGYWVGHPGAEPFYVCLSERKIRR